MVHKKSTSVDCWLIDYQLSNCFINKTYNCGVTEIYWDVTQTAEAYFFKLLLWLLIGWTDEDYC